MTEKRVHTFSNGTEYGGWESHNCHNCWKWSGHRSDTPPRSGDDVSIRRFNCTIDKALGEAYWGDGKVKESIAKRMGLPGYDCTEREKQRPPRKRRAPAIETTPLFKTE